jgi:hypothetical protein
MGEVFERHTNESGVFDEIFFLADDDGLAGVDFCVLDRTAGVCDIGLALDAEALEACAAAEAGDGDLAGEALIFEAVGHALRERVDGRAAGSNDRIGDFDRIDLR